MKALPENFTASMHEKLGQQYKVFLESLEQPAPVSIRIHPKKFTESGFFEAVPWSDFGRYLPSRPVFTLDPLFHAGSYYVQEASSMFLEQVVKQSVDLTKSMSVLDLCAAPGGKSTHLLNLLNRESLLVTNDAIRSRASILSENIQKWGYPNAVVTNNDPADFNRLKGFFDVVVVDAPCSGEGLFRKDAQAIDEWSPENVLLCSARQKRIIADVWDAVKENGIFIYCTCTYNTLENEENLKWLQQHNNTEFLKVNVQPEWGIEEVHENNMFAYRFFPHQTRGEGFFIAVVRKTGSTEQLRLKGKRNLTPPLKKTQEKLRDWISVSGAENFFQFNDLLFYTPSSKAQEIEFLLQHLKIMYAGTNLATLKHEKLIPNHALALSVELRKENFLTADLTEAEAIKYLRRDAIYLEAAPVGFTLITYKNVPLGWANVLSNRVNNMYPSDWRIRMDSRAER
jgi:16S rRNA C967 or C1407 C5-methylase (RsmB/RsmF family)/NOL1/NOP2/fmu family ribosome biogenesis protein